MFKFDSDEGRAMNLGFLKGMGGTPNDSVCNPTRQNNQGFNLSVVSPNLSSSTSSNAQSIWREALTTGGNQGHPLTGQSMFGQMNAPFGGSQFFAPQTQSHLAPMFGGPIFNGQQGNSFNGNFMPGFMPGNSTAGFNSNSGFGFASGMASSFNGSGPFGDFDAFGPSSQFMTSFGAPTFQNQLPGTSGHLQQSGQMSTWRAPAGNVAAQQGSVGRGVSDWLAQFKNSAFSAFFRPFGNTPQPSAPTSQPPQPTVSKDPYTPSSLPPAPTTGYTPVPVPPSPAPEPAPTTGYTPVPIPPSPAPEPAPTTGFTPVPIPPSPAPEPAPTIGFTPVPIPPSPAPAGLSASELATLQLLRDVAQRGAPTPSQKTSILQAYMAFRPDEHTTMELKQIASMFATEAFSRPALVSAAADWDKPNFDRVGVLQELVDIMNTGLGMNVGLSFFNTPTVNGSTNNGYYSTNTDTIRLNTNNSALKSFSLGVKAVVHEMLHAYHFNKTKHLGLDEAMEKAITGEISFTDAMAYFNLRQGNYFDTSETTQLQYEMNPHEQIAFLATDFLEDELKRYNIPDGQRTLASNHPLRTHLRNLGLA
jgi:hypothetical protein